MFVKFIENLFWPKLLIEKLLEKDFFMKIDIFGIFWPKTEKMGRVQKWVFFNFSHFFDWIKKYRKYKKIVSSND